MKFFAPALIFCGAIASSAQTPQVPHKMNFAGMTLTIRDDARHEIQKEVDALTKSPKYFGIKAQRARTYFPIIEKAFEEERVPLDFKYLALQESALVADAVSSSNAVGFWQFKGETAREMGLRVDGEIDERMNIASASRGAAKYLKQCNHYFNNWVFALQAYQMGAGGVMRAVGDKEFGARSMEITSDTYWYVKKYLAHKVAFEVGLPEKPAIEVACVNDAGGKSLTEIAERGSVSESDLREFNKWLKTDRVPTDRSYVVLIPNGKAEVDFGVIATTAPTADKKTVTIATFNETQEINGIPVIKAHEGESIAALAARGGIDLRKFLSYNEMEIDQHLKAGQAYFLEKKKRHASQELYTVHAGEDLWTISQRFGVRQKSLIRYNQLPESISLTGTTLFLSDRRPEVNIDEQDSVVAQLDDADSFEWTHLTISGLREGSEIKGWKGVPAPDSSAIMHEVKQSDTLYGVARQYGVTLRELMEWNDKKDFNLSVGEKLRVLSR